MKKALYATRGPIPQDVIEAADLQLPALEAGQALISVLAAPINPADVLMLTGQYGMLPPLPAIGGSEGVGRVVEVAADVTNVKVGQTVLLPKGSGTWTTHLIASAMRLVPLPDQADPQQLAMMTINPPTALLMLTDYVDLKPGDWVIQNAANSAVGSYLIQIAKLRGLKTVNVVRRESAIAAVKQDGADVVLVDGDDLPKRVAEATGGAKILLGIEAVGGMAMERLARCMGEGGTILSYGGMSGEACMISPGTFIFRDLTLKGFWLSLWFKKSTPERQMAVLGEVAGLIAQGKIKSRIAATYSVDQIKDAIAAATKGERDGKILIVPRN
jgi:trans-2-enoyl-CoA reductase